MFGVFVAAYFLSQFFRHANAVISEDVAGELSLGAAQMGLMTSLFYGAFACAQLPLGSALDRFGARWVTPTLLMAAFAGSLLFGLAHSFGMLAAGRALLGLGMAGVLMGSYMAFSHWFAPERFATMAGLVVGIGALGGLGAASPLAWFAGSFGWRNVFLLGAGAVLVVAAAIAVAGGDPPGTGRLPGAAVEGSVLDVVRRLVFWRIVPLNLFMGGAMMAVQGLWAGEFLFDVAGFSAIEVGRLLTLLSIGAALGYSSCGWLADRLGLSRVLLTAALVYLLAEVGFIVMALRPVTAVMAVQYFVFGYVGGFSILLLAQIRGEFPKSHRGRAITAVNFFGIGGAAVLQWLMGVIIEAFGAVGRGAEATVYPPEAYIAAFGLICAGLLLSILWYLPCARIPAREGAPTLPG